MMGIKFFYPTQATATDEWIPSRAPRWPARRAIDYPHQAVMHTAAGSRVVQDLGNEESRWPLVFNGLNKEDYDEALAFFRAVRKTGNTFEFVDLDGVTHTVRWGNAFNLQKSPAGGGTWSGTIELLEEI